MNTSSKFSVLPLDYLLSVWYNIDIEILKKKEVDKNGNSTECSRMDNKNVNRYRKLRDNVFWKCGGIK